MRENLSISNSNYMIRLIFFVACMIPILLLIGEKYKEAAAKNVVNAFTQRRYDEFYSLPQNTLDMAFIGSSHSYCTFDPENFDSVLGIESYQFGTPLQHPDTSYYVLKEILNNQKPNIVVQELYWDVLDDSFEMKQANSFFEVLKNEDLKKEYIKKVFPIGEKVKYAILPIRFQQDYFAYESDEMAKNMEEKYDIKKKRQESQKGKEEYRSKGYVYCDYTMLPGEYDETNQFKGLDGRDWNFDKTQKEYIEKMIALCESEGIQLIFVTAPVANVSMEHITHYDEIYKSISEFASHNNIPYIDYNIVNEEENILTNENFRDDAHLNDSGVKKVNAHFLNWIQNVIK